MNLGWKVLVKEGLIDLGWVAREEDLECWEGSWLALEGRLRYCFSLVKCYCVELEDFEDQEIER
jgi:hypothetical protein